MSHAVMNMEFSFIWDQTWYTSSNIGYTEFKKITSDNPPPLIDPTLKIG